MRPLTRAEWQLAAGLAILIWCACTPARPTPLDFSGNWTGTTSQGKPIAFTVSSDLRITTVSLEYAFATCTGVVNTSASAPLTNPSGTASAMVVHAPNGSGAARTVVNFLFPSPTSANGTVQFIDYPGCGSGNATWTASRQ